MKFTLVQSDQHFAAVPDELQPRRAAPGPVREDHPLGESGPVRLAQGAVQPGVVDLVYVPLGREQAVGQVPVVRQQEQALSILVQPPHGEEIPPPELLRQEDLPPAAADYAKIIDQKAQRLKTMVEDVFDVSKAAADQLPVHLERLDLGKLLRQTLADMDGPIQASALTFKAELPEEPVMITADGRRLYRVFQNLLDNALRYALEGSRVYLRLKTAEGTAEASVRSTSRTELPEGVDFTARFVRGDSSRTDGGSGLGLSIAKSFTEACGGSFRVETVADLFTAVVTFPVEGD